MSPLRILTLTMNPAVDLSTGVDRVMPTHKLRCEAPERHPGGGGVNVARVATRLGADALALFPAGGVGGQVLQTLLAGENVRFEATAIAGETRENMTVHESAGGQDYRFVLPGPTLTNAETEACLARVLHHAPTCGMVVASGSLPPGVPPDFYAGLARALGAMGVPLVLDSSGPPLAAALAAGVHLCKPSLRELEEYCGQELRTVDAQKAACRAIVARGGARMVALSLGAQGALLVTAQAAWVSEALKVPARSTVGAGDSFVAGMVRALALGEPPEQAFALAMAASAAAVMSAGTALCSKEDVHRLLAQVRIHPV